MAEISVGVKIWGEVSQFIKSLTQGKEGLKGIEKQAHDSFKGMSDSVKSAEMKFKNLAATMGINSPEAKQALAGLTAIKSKYVEINNAAAGAGKNNGIFSGLKGQLVGLGAGFFGASVAVGALTSVMSDALNGALEDERAEKKLAFALNGRAEATKRMLGFKEQMMVSTLFNEDEIMGAMNMGLALGRTEQETKKLVETAMGLSRATGVDLNTAMMQLSATYEGNIGKLGKLAGEVKGLSEEELKNGKAVDVLKEKYGKFMSEGIGTTQGDLIQLKKWWGETLDTVGRYLWKFISGVKQGFEAIGKLIGGTAGVNAKKLAAQRSELKGAQDNIAAMREQAALDQNRNFYLEKLAKAQKDNAKAAKETNDEWVRMAYLAEQVAANFVGPMGAGEVDRLAPKAGAVTTRGGGGTLNKTGFDFSKLPDSTATAWEKAIEKIQGALGGLSSSAHAAFNGIARFAKLAADNFHGGWQNAMETVAGAVQGAVGFIGDLFSQQSQKRITELDQQTEAQREQIENSQMSEEAKQKALNDLDKDSAKKKKELMREQAKREKTVSLMQAIVSGALAVVQAFAAGPGIGLIMGLLMTGLVAAQVASIASQPLPALATGGLAYAPTMAMVGDNPNANINPEVIAPLDKLKSMIGFGEEGGMLTARVSGDDLLFVLNRAERSKYRRY